MTTVTSTTNDSIQLLDDKLKMLRTAAFRLLRSANIRTHRPISTSVWCSSSQNVRKSVPNVDELFTKDRPPIEPLIEDPIIVKKFLVSEVDSEQMLYPEVISRDELDSLININRDVSESFATKIEFDVKGITKSTHDTFKESGLIATMCRKSLVNVDSRIRNLCWPVKLKPNKSPPLCH